VDLALVRQREGDYISLLSSSTRSLLRRSHRGYEARGPVRLEAAADQKTATEIFDEMVRLHKKSWQTQGETSAFDSDFFQRFHRELIRKRLNSGEIQLLRITAGDTTIGCLYNFVFNGWIYGYQSGFQYEDDKHLTPGFTSFVEAIKYSAAQGYAAYDFLGGDAAYKSRLCTNQQRLIWVKVQKPRIQFRVETRLKALKQFAQSLRTENSVDPASVMLSAAKNLFSSGSRDSSLRSE
jgi:CelD/BcsL family acetyltransferase involved in cellulose biosynthesis